jgi:hypothetical protein
MSIQRQCGHNSTLEVPNGWHGAEVPISMRLPRDEMARNRRGRSPPEGKVERHFGLVGF